MSLARKARGHLLTSDLAIQLGMTMQRCTEGDMNVFGEEACMELHSDLWTLPGGERRVGRSEMS